MPSVLLEVALPTCERFASTNILVLRKLEQRSWECEELKGDREFERIGLMTDYSVRYSAETFEERSSTEAIQHEVVVKIV